MSFKLNSAQCLTIDYSASILGGLDQDGDEPIRILPYNEEDEFTIGTGGCASINVKDRSAVIVEIDFSNCSGSLSAIRQSKEQIGTGTVNYLAVDDTCNGDSFFSNCVYPLTNISRSFGNNPGVKTVRFLAMNPVFNDAVFTI